MSEAIKTAGKEVTTDTGFTCVLDEDALDDYELFAAFVDMDNRENGIVMLKGFEKVLDSLLGDDQKARLFEHIKAGNNGRVRMTALKTELIQIFSKLGESKKN